MAALTDCKEEKHQRVANCFLCNRTQVSSWK